VDRSRLAAPLVAAFLSCSLARPVCGADPGASTEKWSVARLWDELLLDAIRVDIPKPPAHARNLFHLSVAMWDAWAAYSRVASGYIVTEKRTARDVNAERAAAISFAAYRLLKHRFPEGALDADGKPCHPNAARSQAAFDAQMDALGYDKAFTSTVGSSPAALGNRIAAAMIAYGERDGANEGAGLCYPDDTGYVAANAALIFKFPGVGPIVDPNRWQPLAFDFSVTQNGIPIGAAIQRFVGVGWGRVTPFALGPEDADAVTHLALDPGPQPRLGGADDAVVKDAMVELIRMSSQLDEAQDAELDISPGAMFDDSLGKDDGAGRPVNPATGAPYARQVVKRADYDRVIAEFWADGPRSETPPGHWNVIANSVSDRLAATDGKRLGGKGRILSDLDWDVKVYLALNGAVHDAAIWAWGNKTFYDSSRPITLIRYMAGLGQSSDPAGPSYHPQGLPLVPDLIELITTDTTKSGGRHASLAGHEGEIALHCWLGGPSDPATQVGGVGWKLGVEWMPYQARTFVTPPFPGYTSGHSAFSRAGAEVLAAITGTPFFPGGLGTFVARQDAFLATERGPSRTIELQWATYYDAADQAAISRRFGGIHPYYDDFPSRVAGSRIGKRAWERAEELYAPSKDPRCGRRPVACETFSSPVRP
jgi:hypothetical protein